MVSTCPTLSSCFLLLYFLLFFYICLIVLIPASAFWVADIFPFFLFLTFSYLRFHQLFFQPSTIIFIFLVPLTYIGVNFLRFVILRFVLAQSLVVLTSIIHHSSSSPTFMRLLSFQIINDFLVFVPLTYIFSLFLPFKFLAFFLPVPVMLLSSLSNSWILCFSPNLYVESLSRFSFLCGFFFGCTLFYFPSWLINKFSVFSPDLHVESLSRSSFLGAFSYWYT